jgi:hypothetical protein
MKFDIENFINKKLKLLYKHLDECKKTTCQSCRQFSFDISTYEELLYYIDKDKRKVKK